MTQIKDKTTGNWVVVAGGQRTWVGTKEALQTALNNSEIPNGTPAMVTNDYDYEKNNKTSEHFYLGTGVYDRPYLPRTITISTTGRNVLIVTPHMGSTPVSGSTPGYQSNYSPAVFDIAQQLYEAPTTLRATFPVYDETTGEVTWSMIHFANVTAVTQDTITLSTEGITSEFQWFHVHVI